MIFSDTQEAEHYLKELRRGLDLVFAPDTKSANAPLQPPSAGHCAVVAIVVFRLLGARLVSTKVDGVSHWFNVVRIADLLYDVDLTGDQFGRAAVQIAPVGDLYGPSRERRCNELTDETLERHERLMRRLEEKIADPEWPA